MKPEEFIKYLEANGERLLEEIARREYEEINGNDEYYRLIGEEIEKRPIGCPRRRRGS